MDDAGDEHVHGQPRPLVSFLGRLDHVAQIVADTGNAQQAALFLQALQDLFIAHTLAAQEIAHAGVHVAHPVGVDQAGFQTHAEADVHAPAVFDGADRAAPAQVTGDGLVVSALLIEHVGDIAVGGAVVAQALHAVLFVPLIGHAEEFSLKRDGPVKGRLEAADEPGLGQKTAHNGNSVQIGPVVQWGQADPFLHAPQHLVVQLVDTEMVFGKRGLVAHALDLGNGCNDAHVRPGQIVEEEPDAAFVVGNVRLVEGGLLPSEAVFIAKDRVKIRTHALHAALGKDAGLGHIVQLEFQGSAPHVAHKNFHRFFPLQSEYL